MEFLKGASGYQDLADRLRAAIRDGTLTPGHRLPSQRRLAYDLGLAVGTVTRAFEVLEREALIDSHVGRGTFVAHSGSRFGTGFGKESPAGIDLSLDLPLEHLNPGIGDILATMSAVPATESLLHYMEAGAQRRFARVGADWLNRFGFSVSPEIVVPAFGSQHALFCALASVCRPGDVVAAETLAYPGLMGAVKTLGLRTEAVAMDPQGIVPAALEEVCKRAAPTAIYLTPSYQNPTTARMGVARREALADIAERFNLTVIEDELKPRAAIPAPAPIAALVPHRTLFISGLSKIVGGGLRTAFMVVPSAYRERVDHNIWASAWKPSPLIFEVAARLIESGEADRAMNLKEDEAQARRALADRRLGDLDVRMGPGGTYAWLVLPHGWTNASAVSALKERGVAVISAEAFRTGHAPPPDALRLCLGAQPDRATLDDGLQRVGEVLRGEPQLPRL